MFPSVPPRAASILALTAVLLAPGCGGDEPDGAADAGVPALPHGAPDRTVSGAPGASFVGPLPAPGTLAPTSPAQPVAAPWSSTFVGASAGSAADPMAAVRAGDRAFAVEAAGTGLNIAATSDDFLFVHRTLAGDGAVVGLLRAVEGCPTGRISFGLMIRAGTDSTAAYALATVSGSTRGIALQARPLASLVASTLRLDATVALPVWLKVERTGERVRCGYSTDGVNWTEGDSLVYDFGVEVEVGLAGSAHRDGACRGLFEAVEVIGPRK